MTKIEHCKQNGGFSVLPVSCSDIKTIRFKLRHLYDSAMSVNYILRI